jgi:predicted transcriptional regulator
MKDKIIDLRKSGFSYNKIVEILGCSKSTISYHCNKENLGNPINKKDKKNIKEDNSIDCKKIETKPKQKELTKCLNCGNLVKNKFCSIKCFAEHKHKCSYDDYLKNNEKYCSGNYTPKSFKDFFIKEQNNKCKICEIEPEWMGKKLVFIIDHIDGDASNNKRENIRLICPNCDSQTDTFKSKTKKSKRRNYWKEKIIRDLNK